MGLIIKLENEKGKKYEEVRDSKNFLMKAIKDNDVSKTFCLRFIDPYGNTVFNRLQVIQFKEELAEIHDDAENQEKHNLFVKIEEMIDNCLVQPHRYLKFYGD